MFKNSFKKSCRKVMVTIVLTISMGSLLACDDKKDEVELIDVKFQTNSLTEYQCGESYLIDITIIVTPFNPQRKGALDVKIYFYDADAVITEGSHNADFAHTEEEGVTIFAGKIVTNTESEQTQFKMTPFNAGETIVKMTADSASKNFAVNEGSGRRTENTEYTKGKLKNPEVLFEATSLSWSPIKYANSYRVYSIDSLGNELQVKSLAVNETSWQIPSDELWLYKDLDLAVRAISDNTTSFSHSDLSNTGRISGLQ